MRRKSAIEATAAYYCVKFQNVSSKMQRLLFIFFLFFSCSLFAKEKLIIGIAEQPQCSKASNYSARALFTIVNKKWVPIDAHSGLTIENLGNIEWTIAFDGRNLGQHSTIDPTKEGIGFYNTFYNRDKLLHFKNQTRVPRVKNKSKLFGGWCDSPSLRPLVLVNSPNFVDPEKWKPFVPNSSYKHLLYPMIKEIVGDKAIKCEDYDWTTVKPYDFKPEELLLYKSYRAKSGKELVAISLDTKKITCDGPAEKEWDITWFLLIKNEVTFLDHGLNLVDAGDYDKDGKSEVLFWHSGYNQDGYVLFYDDFKESARFTWAYH